MKNQMAKRIASVLLAGVMLVSLAACGENKKTEEKKTDDSKKSSKKETEIQVFIAASLNTVMTELAKEYNEDHPEVKITFNADSSGTLLTQIEEGYECDLFFSAAQKQMDQLEADGLVVDGTRANVLNNQVVVISLKDSGTKVTGLENLKCQKYCTCRRKRSGRKVYKTGTCKSRNIKNRRGSRCHYNSPGITGTRWS